tara:strand:+ start:636 stop:1271 length:636 start_codon:yes stop_codon:yes gene_type:complete
MSVLKNKLIVFVLIFITNFTYSQDIGTDNLWQLSPEITLKTKKFEFRFRPQERIILNNEELNSKITFGRTDLMAGFVYKKFKFFIYSRYDTRKQLYIGPRIDFNTTAFNKRLLIHGQYRIFRGLNSQSKDHQFIINLIEYDTNLSSKKSINFGILGSYQQKFGSTALIFQGPMVHFPFFLENVSFVLSYLKDFNSRSRYFTFFQMNIKLKV